MRKLPGSRSTKSRSRLTQRLTRKNVIHIGEDVSIELSESNRWNSARVTIIAPRSKVITTTKRVEE